MRRLDENSQIGGLAQLGESLLFLLVDAYSDDDESDSGGI